MTSREKLAADLDAVQRTSRTISRIVWTVAAAVMLYGIPIVYDLLIHHQAPELAALLLSPAVDAALCVGLVATPVLAMYNVPAGWIGALRWIAGLATWGLQTAGSWTRAGGPDWVGVYLHSVGPLILFAVVEGASYFQRRMGEVVAAKRAELEAADRKAADDRAEIAGLRQKLHAVTVDRDAYLRQVEELTSERSKVITEAEAEIASVRAAHDRAEAEITRLRGEHTDRVEALHREHTEAVRRLKDRHAEKLAEIRAEAGTVKLSDYRRRPSAAAAKPTNRPRMSDEEAVQKLLAENDDPSYPWNQSEIVTVTGCGWGRAPRLLAAITEENNRRASEATGTAASDGAEATG